MTAKQSRQQGKGKVEVVDSSTAPAAPRRKVETAEIVLYAQPAASQVQGLSDVVYLPMIVTRVHNDESTIDGVVFATGDTTFTGARCIYNIEKGDAEMKWKFIRK